MDSTLQSIKVSLRAQEVTELPSKKLRPPWGVQCSPYLIHLLKRRTPYSLLHLLDVSWPPPPFLGAPIPHLGNMVSSHQFSQQFPTATVWRRAVSSSKTAVSSALFWLALQVCVAICHTAASEQRRQLLELMKWEVRSPWTSGLASMEQNFRLGAL